MLGSYSSYLSLIVFYSSDGFVICHATRPSLCKRSRIDSLIFNPDKTGRLQPHRGCLAVTCLAELGARGLMGYRHTGTALHPYNYDIRYYHHVPDIHHTQLVLHVGTWS